MDYLAKNKKRPFQTAVPLAKVTVQDTVRRAKVYVDNTDPITPESCALWFYMQNHAQACLDQKYDRYEPLPADALALVNEYHSSMTKASVRMFYYLLLICTRESRHIRSWDSMGPFMKEKYGAHCVNFTSKIRGVSSGAAVSSFYKFPSAKLTLDKYCTYLHELFQEGEWAGGFGGSNWAAIAKVLRDFVLGDMTPEMMMDTAFTLAHNNGPIFNKGLVFSMYNLKSLTRILDVQRSGQIPQYVLHSKLEDAQHNLRLTSAHKEYQVRAASLLGSNFLGYVDWFAVSDIHGELPYDSEKQAQIDLHGKPAYVEAQELKQNKIKQAADEQQAKAMSNWHKHNYAIMPNLNAKKLTRETEDV